MIDVDILLRTSRVTLMLSHEPPGCGPANAFSEESRDAISLVEVGALAVLPSRSAPDAAWLLAPGMVLATPRGADIACHRAQTDDAHRCLSVSYSAAAIEELRATGFPALSLSAMRATPRHRFLRRRLRSLCGSPAGGEAFLRLELLAGSLYESVTRPDAAERSNAVSMATIRRIADAADFIEAEYPRAIRLADMARVATMSTFHFARVFARLAGVPPHRYLVATRLRAAVRRIEAGDSVTSACYAVGFTSPSHFTAAFRQYFGVAPSSLRRDRSIATLSVALGTSAWHCHASRPSPLALGA